MGLTILQRILTNRHVDVGLRLPSFPRNLLERYKLQRRIRPGEYFIDGRSNQPCLVVRCELTSVSAVGPWDFDIVAVSFVDGHTVIGNSARHSGLTPLPCEVAVNHLIVAFWTRGTGPDVWQDAAEHVGKMLQSNADYQAFTTTS
jgi:hypothetical protein